MQGMEYLHRHLENQLKRLAQKFKVVLILGAWQVGKSTILEHIFPEAKVIVFDPVEDLYNARKDPDLFLNAYSGSLILDEIQYAPEVLAALKRRVDRSEKKGQYFLTSSQNLSVLKNVAESMAGRLSTCQFLQILIIGARMEVQK
jgi:predicted AAA+ superfamily ATPase